VCRADAYQPVADKRKKGKANLSLLIRHKFSQLPIYAK
jgi:hypothetical protein